ncbi:hypothetical protein ED28_01325 [[Pantoea] beijingensis]|uniref:Uncharacterized protein n=1 Tax=[Pantoea] beijingensis TaxID=1324864 RepID=A0A443IHM8_9GAMM|nr:MULTISPECIES: hypothetical protein [Erwiniaceae]RWR03655.1 hypothetical protein ED28_01325 [[Pantoea] beijingensis]
MKNEKEISINEFTDNEKILIEQQVQLLVTKLGKQPDAKQLKELTKEAKRLVMKERLAKEKANPPKVPRKPKAKKIPASDVKDFSWSNSIKQAAPRRK